MSTTKEIELPGQSVLEKIIAESSLAKPGNDSTIVTIYSLADDLSNCLDNSVFRNACKNLRDALERLMENSSPLDQRTCDYIYDFINWANDSIMTISNGHAVTAFPPLKQEEQKPESNKSTNKEATNNAEEEAARKHDELIVLNIDSDKELLTEFIAESTEHLESIEATLLNIEDNPSDSESLNTVFRAFHSIKGVAGFLNLKPIQGLAHEVESLLDLARQGKVVLDSKFITIIFQSRDTINACIGQIITALEKNLLPTEVITVSNLIIQIKNLIRDYFVKKERVAAKAENFQEEESNNVSSKGTEESNNELIDRINSTQNTSIRINIEKMDNLMNTIGELSILHNQIQEGYKNSLKVPNGESLLEEALQQFSRITKDLQHNSMSLRMMPIKPTFQKISRIARDLAKNLNKQIEFKVSGEDTELDRTVIEQISDPLIHMIRNSIDHGVETTEERSATEKTPIAVVKLKAYHSEGNIIIELSDDGRGIDSEKVMNKAIQLGIISDTDILSEAEAQALIFQPGFSTSQEITDISGRGVGMDVVKRNIESLHGKIDIFSTKGVGTTFKIKLPLTLAIIDGLLIRIEDERFILPTTAVKNVIQYDCNKLTKLQEKNEIVSWQDKTVPLLRLNEYFKLSESSSKAERGAIIIMESADDLVGIYADEMINKQEFVIKNLGSFLKNVHGFSGGTILGDGSVSLIIDPSLLSTN